MRGRQNVHRVRMRGYPELRRRRGRRPARQCDDGNHKPTATAARPTASADVSAATASSSAARSATTATSNAGDGCSASCQTRALRQRRSSSPGEQCDDAQHRRSATAARPTASSCARHAAATARSIAARPATTATQTDGDGCSRFCQIELRQRHIDRRAASSATTATPPRTTAAPPPASSRSAATASSRAARQCDDGAQNGVLGDALLDHLLPALVRRRPRRHQRAVRRRQRERVRRVHAAIARRRRPRRAPSARRDPPPRASPAPTPRLRSAPRLRLVGVLRGRLHARPHRPTATTATLARSTPATRPRGCVQHAESVRGRQRLQRRLDAATRPRAPASHGPAPDCDDHDACTDDDRCVSPSARAPSAPTTLRAGAALATCRLDAIERPARRRRASRSPPVTSWRSSLKKVRRKLPLAAGTGKKAAQALKQANNAMASLTRTVAKAGKKIPPDVRERACATRSRRRPRRSPPSDAALRRFIDSGNRLIAARGAR